MANTITEHVFIDGPRNLVVQYGMFADGSGNYSKFPFFDIVNYAPMANNATPDRLRIQKISSHTGAGTSGQLFIKGSAGTYESIHYLPTNEMAKEDYSGEGGLSTGAIANWDGKIYIDTQGFDAANDYIELVIWAKKARTFGLGDDKRAFGYNVSAEDKTAHTGAATTLRGATHKGYTGPTND